MQSPSVSYQDRSGFFASDAWALVLKKGFGVLTHELVLSASTRYRLHIFKKGPFKIAYVAFPVCVAEHDVNAIVDQISSSGLDVHLLRCVSHGVTGLTEIASVIAQQPETVLYKLDCYDPYQNKKLRRDLIRANKFNTLVVCESGVKQADDIYNMYENTLRIRYGNVRYNRAYFSALLDLGTKDDNVCIFTAYVDTALVGFLVLIVDGKEAYYLHGAYDRAFNKMGVTDILLENAISYAQKKGALSFNMGASPVDQPQLTRYKEKWGAITIPQYTIEYKKDSLRAACFYIASYGFSLVTNVKYHLSGA